MSAETITIFKILLAGSRGWAVSRTYPLGRETYIILERGLAQLHKQGIVTRAYRETGVINSKVKDWRIINPQVTATSAP